MDLSNANQDVAESGRSGLEISHVVIDLALMIQRTQYQRVMRNIVDVNPRLPVNFDDSRNISEGERCHVSGAVRRKNQPMTYSSEFPFFPVRTSVSPRTERVIDGQEI